MTDSLSSETLYKHFGIFVYFGKNQPVPFPHDHMENTLIKMFLMVSSYAALRGVDEKDLAAPENRISFLPILS